MMTLKFGTYFGILGILGLKYQKHKFNNSFAENVRVFVLKTEKVNFVFITETNFKN